MSSRQIDKMRALANNPNFISGIHNYCDRWCERCPLTARCSVFAMEAEHEGQTKCLDPQNEAFWKQLHEIFSGTVELLREMAVEAGIDPDAPIPEEYEVEREQIRQQTTAHPLVSAAADYRMAVQKWLEAADSLFANKEEELNAMVRMDLPGADPQADAVSVRDATEVIQWYHTVINAKIRRAVQQELEGLPACLADMPKDSDGSAKVALICIDRSMAAWMRMREHFPEQRDQILDFLIALDRLRRETEQMFPNARSFVRPRFDA